MQVVENKRLDIDENGKYIGQSMWNRGFVAMLITQFTVALNDNMFRWLIVPIGKAYVNEDLIRTFGGLFLLVPFLLWTSVAGYVTDRYSRRNVMIWCKAVEMILLGTAIFFLCLGPDVPTGDKLGIFGTPKIPLLLMILFLLGTQSSFFSPSKYGSLPDLVPEHQLSDANGIIAMTTMIACVGGQILGGFLFAWTSLFEVQTFEQAGKMITRSEPVGVPGSVHFWISILFLVGAALIGLIASFFIPRLKAVDSNAKFPKRIFLQTGRDIGELFSHRKLFWVSIASSFFWGLAALAAVNIDKFRDVLNVDQQYISTLAAVLSIGIGVGAVFCGIWSRGRIEMGLVPVGAFGIGFFLLLLGFTPVGTGTVWSFSYVYAAIMLFLMGVAAGLFDIPLAAYIQHNCPVDRRGRLLAAYNFFSFGGMIFFTIAFLVVAGLLDTLSSAQILDYPPSLTIWVMSGFMVLAVFGVLAYALFLPLCNLGFTFILWLLYRPKVVGRENIPTEGGVLFVSNHVSYLDGLLIYTSLEKGVRFFAHVDYIPGRFCNALADSTRIIRVLPGKKVVHAIKEARDGLKAGDSLCIFPEGGITRTGQIGTFEPGFLSILKGDANVPIVPVYLGGIFGSMFSYAYGTRLHLPPRQLKQHIVVAFGKPIYHPKEASSVRRIVQELGIEAMKMCGKELPIPARTMIRSARQKGNTPFLIGLDGMMLTGRAFLQTVLLGSSVLKRLIAEQPACVPPSPPCSQRSGQNVGILFPIGMEGVLVNATLALTGHVAVNLDPGFSDTEMLSILQTAKIRSVVTNSEGGKRLRELARSIKCPNDTLSSTSLNVIVWEEMLQSATSSERFWTGIDLCLPICLLERIRRLKKIKPNDRLAICFEHGKFEHSKQEMPVGIVLTQKNVAEGARAWNDTIRVKPDDVQLGVLPLSSVLGYCNTVWGPLLSESKGLIASLETPFSQSTSYSESESESVSSVQSVPRIAQLAKEQGCTILVGTPDILEKLLECSSTDLSGVKTVICICKTIPVELCDKWEQQLGVRPVFGYALAESTGCATVNLPELRIPDDYFLYHKDGTLGRELPYSVLKIVDPTTGEEMNPGESGQIILAGPGVAMQYVVDSEERESLFKDNWCHTGDVGSIDTDGFVRTS